MPPMSTTNEIWNRLIERGDVEHSPPTRELEKAEELARRWMPGWRQGRPGDPERRAAEHPADLVRLFVEEFPGKVSAGMLVVAWLHDIIEDGVKEDRCHVTKEDLHAEGIRGNVVGDILALSKGNNETKMAYLARLKDAPTAGPRVRLVKCVDRICNLREGQILFKDKRWARYVGETYYFILPLTEGLDSYEGEWLREKLIEAASARPVR